MLSYFTIGRKNMAIAKFKSAKIKLYSNQFEVHEVDGKPVPSHTGVWVGDMKEVLVSFGIWIEKYMNLRKKVPLIIEITEAGQVIMSPGSNKKS